MLLHEGDDQPTEVLTNDVRLARRALGDKTIRVAPLSPPGNAVTSHHPMATGRLERRELHDSLAGIGDKHDLPVDSDRPRLMQI